MAQEEIKKSINRKKRLIEEIYRELLDDNGHGDIIEKSIVIIKLETQISVLEKFLN